MKITYTVICLATNEVITLKVTRVCVCQLLLIDLVPPNILINSEINLRSLLVIANTINAHFANQN